MLKSLDRPLTFHETWLLLLVCVALLAGVAGWVAHGVALH